MLKQFYSEFCRDGLLRRAQRVGNEVQADACAAPTASLHSVLPAIIRAFAAPTVKYFRLALSFRARRADVNPQTLHQVTSFNEKILAGRIRQRQPDLLD